MDLTVSDEVLLLLGEFWNDGRLRISDWWPWLVALDEETFRQVVCCYNQVDGAVYVIDQELTRLANGSPSNSRIIVFDLEERLVFRRRRV